MLTHFPTNFPLILATKCEYTEVHSKSQHVQKENRILFIVNSGKFFEGKKAKIYAQTHIREEFTKQWINK